MVGGLLYLGADVKKITTRIIIITLHSVELRVEEALPVPPMDSDEVSLDDSSRNGFGPSKDTTQKETENNKEEHIKNTAAETLDLTKDMNSSDEAILDDDINNGAGSSKDTAQKKKKTIKRNYKEYH